MLRGYSKFLDVLEKVEKAILAVTVGTVSYTHLTLPTN